MINSHKLLKAFGGTFGLIVPLATILLLRKLLGSYESSGMGLDYPAFTLGLAVDAIVIFITGGWAIQNGAIAPVPDLKKAFLIIAIVCLLISAVIYAFEYHVIANPSQYNSEDLPRYAQWSLAILGISYFTDVGMRY